jgi:hypothetical protein
MRAGRDLAEQARARQIGRDHLGDLLGKLRRRRSFGKELRHGEGQGFDHAFGDLDAQRALRKGGLGKADSGGQQARQATGRSPKGSQQWQKGHRSLIPSGLNVISILRHWSYFSTGRSKPDAPQRRIARRAT